MTALNKQALRETNSKPVKRIEIGIDEYTWLPIEKACPEGKYVLHSDYLSLLDELEAAENRIAELEAREVMLPTPYPKGYGLAADKYNFALEECADAIRAAGIGVKGE